MKNGKEVRAIFLRGVNVSGKNKIKMAELRSALSSVGFGNVQTYIQSGNIVLQSDLDGCAVNTSVKSILQSDFDVDVPLINLSTSDIRAVLDEIPFMGDPSKILIYFFLSQPDAEIDINAFEVLCAETEEIYLSKYGVVINVPDGIGRSKLVAKLEGLLPVDVTGRNLRSVSKIFDLMSDIK